MKILVILFVSLILLSGCGQSEVSELIIESEYERCVRACTDVSDEDLQGCHNNEFSESNLIYIARYCDCLKKDNNEDFCISQVYG